MVTAVTEARDSEVGEGGVSGDAAAVATGPAAVVAMATTEEEDRNAASAKLLITEVPASGLIRLSLLWTGKAFYWLSVVMEISIIMQAVVKYTLVEYTQIQYLK